MFLTYVRTFILRWFNHVEANVFLSRTYSGYFFGKGHAASSAESVNRSIFALSQRPVEGPNLHVFVWGLPVVSGPRSYEVLRPIGRIPT